MKNKTPFQFRDFGQRLDLAYSLCFLMQYKGSVKAAVINKAREIFSKHDMHGDVYLVEISSLYNSMISFTFCVTAYADKMNLVEIPFPEWGKDD